MRRRRVWILCEIIYEERVHIHHDGVGECMDGAQHHDDDDDVFRMLSYRMPIKSKLTRHTFDCWCLLVPCPMKDLSLSHIRLNELTCPLFSFSNSNHSKWKIFIWIYQYQFLSDIASSRWNSNSRKWGLEKHMLFLNFTWVGISWEI